MSHQLLGGFKENCLYCQLQKYDDIACGHAIGLSILASNASQLPLYAGGQLPLYAGLPSFLAPPAHSQLEKLGSRHLFARQAGHQEVA